MTPHTLPKDFDVTYCAIGLMVTRWGWVEELLRDIILILYHNCDGKNTETCKKAGMPRTQFSRMVKFLKEIFDKPLIIEYQDEAISLIIRAEKLVKHRDTVIHSAVTNLKPKCFRFTKHKYDKVGKLESKPKFKHSEYTLNDILHYQKMMELLAVDLTRFLHKIGRNIYGEEFDLQLSPPLGDITYSHLPNN